MRVIFVGMHNKPGKSPLCSTTRSGKLIDKIIEKLPVGTAALKSNLYDLDYWPDEDNLGLYQWAKRVDFTTDDIVVTLGAAVNYRFRKWPHKYVAMGHPAMRMGIAGTHDGYVERALKRISEFKP